MIWEIESPQHLSLSYWALGNLAAIYAVEVMVTNLYSFATIVKLHLGTIQEANKNCLLLFQEKEASAEFPNMKVAGFFFALQ